jgi:protein-tyrosine phosphatase
MAASAGESPFEIVILCTGNRFRSPIAEGMIRTLAVGVPVRVSSLGLVDVGPVPPLPEALEEAARIGLDITSHRARPLAGQDLGQTDLLLGFERIHVASAVVDAGALHERAFTLPELVELLEEIEPPPSGDPVARARSVIAFAGDQRRSLPAPSLLPEVRDPWGGPPDLYVETAERVVDLCAELVPTLFGVTPSRAEPGRGSRRGLSRDR